MGEKRISRCVRGHSVTVTNRWRNDRPRDEVWVVVEPRANPQGESLWMSELEFRDVGLMALEMLEMFRGSEEFLFDQEQLDALSGAPAFSGKDEFLVWASKQRKETV